MSALIEDYGLIGDCESVALANTRENDERQADVFCAAQHAPILLPRLVTD